jgi:hypothetical protein
VIPTPEERAAKSAKQARTKRHNPLLRSTVAGRLVELMDNIGGMYIGVLTGYALLGCVTVDREYRQLRRWGLVERATGGNSFVLTTWGEQCLTAYKELQDGTP